jgi:hypothetical protein
MQPLLWSESPHLFASNFGVAAMYPEKTGVKSRDPGERSHRSGCEFIRIFKCHENFCKYLIFLSISCIFN